MVEYWSGGVLNCMGLLARFCASKSLVPNSIPPSLPPRMALPRGFAPRASAFARQHASLLEPIRQIAGANEGRGYES